MPNYEYACEKCELSVEIQHSMLDKPEIKCEKCGGICKKQITSFYLGLGSNPGVSEMKKDLSLNYGIEQVQMLDGSFENLYHGIKKDGARVKEEMKQNKENIKKNPSKKLTTKELDQRVSIIKENKAKKEYNKRKITI